MNGQQPHGNDFILLLPFELLEMIVAHLDLSTWLNFLLAHFGTLARMHQLVYRIDLSSIQAMFRENQAFIRATASHFQGVPALAVLQGGGGGAPPLAPPPAAAASAAPSGGNIGAGGGPSHAPVAQPFSSPSSLERLPVELGLLVFRRLRRPDQACLAFSHWNLMLRWGIVGPVDPNLILRIAWLVRNRNR